MTAWYARHKVVAAATVIAAVATVVTTTIAVADFLDAESDDPGTSPQTSKADSSSQQQAPASTASTPQEDPPEGPVRWDGTIRLTHEVGFAEADLDALPVVPAENGDFALDYDGTLDITKGKAFSARSFNRRPSRETCLDKATNEPDTGIELSEGEYACVISDRDRPAVIQPTQGWTTDDDGESWIELRITTWDH